ncbi:PII uridylyltransferase [Gordonia araii NBRC 100433]|uniref:Bifunctional uridylyltransferase/uridylyl-removing enzyme n=1 Tax=Gordonia araii NBRC 100433 TaxID=1073574 RepID=G7H543_9ACTN|nr:[protein-PII] uridylyltransferase [Gordonia araii]NNG96658.1 [protein-PII] uridylyltransferase [Gordonia araii NBRC 100433]GAB10968.1 PII uridylyltransferase [Gordonia araii NBRC 100433]
MSVGPATNPATDLVRARAALIGNPRLTPDKRPVPDAAALRRALGDLFELWLSGAAGRAGLTKGSGFALLAVGGLARGEMLPYSDLDLVLLHDGDRPDRVQAVADELWYPIWDANIGLDHSVRTVPDALRVAGEDLSAALGLLEARHIAGDEDLSDLLIGEIRQQWRMQAPRRLPKLIEHAEQRWVRSGEVAHRSEPDVKNGRGGLRDVQLLNALALAQLTDGLRLAADDAPGGGLGTAYRRLLDVRTELHRVAGRGREQLRAQDADEIAAALHLGDRFALSRLISDEARTISYAVEVGLRTARGAAPRRGLSMRGLLPVRRPLDEGVVEHGGEVVLARDAIPSHDPGLVLRAANAAARSGLPISSSTLHRLADYSPEIRGTWPGAIRDSLLDLLSTGPAMLEPIEALDRMGLWGRLFPEWDFVRDLPPRDAMHAWTVDRHLLEAVAHAAPLTTQVSRPDLLLLGALVHDIGKGRGGDHSEIGARMARVIGTRLGLWPGDVDVLAEIVAQHLLLAQTIARRDVDDPETAEYVATKVGGSAVLLEILGALAEADAKATGPGVWSDWKQTLTSKLVANTTKLITGEGVAEPVPLSAEEVARFRADEVVVEIAPTDQAHRFEVTMSAPDSAGMLAKMAGVLAFSDLRVLRATVRSEEGTAINSFTVAPFYGDPPEPGLLRQRLMGARSGSVDVAARLAAMRTMSVPRTPIEGVPGQAVLAPPVARWVHDDVATLEVRATDRPGLLSAVASVIERNNGSIRWAAVTTMGGTVVDTFALTWESSVDDRRRDRILDQVREACASV